jgi:hypothetical protein
MSIGLWCAGVEHRDGGPRLRWRSCGLVLMDREQWRMSVGSWLTYRSRGVTSRGGWQLVHIIARGHGGVDCVAGMFKDWWDTRLYVGMRTRCDTHVGLVVYASKPPSTTYGGFYWVWTSKLGDGGSRGNYWWHVASQQRVHQGEATSCEACGRRIENLGVGLFCP